VCEQIGSRRASARPLFAPRQTHLDGFPATVRECPRTARNRFASVTADVILVVPLAADDAIGLAMFLYDGGVTVGLCADCAFMLDLDVLADGFRDAVIRPDRRRAA
jgi:hypothetical protein